MSILNNPSFYISIASSIGFIVSEILPFIPIKSNGVLHAILVCISQYKPQQQTIKNNLIVSKNCIMINLDDDNDIKTKLNLILEKLNKK